MNKFGLPLLILIFALGFKLYGQTPLQNHELRAVWIATVTNLDWPDSGNQTEAQKQQSLTNRLRNLKDAGFNVVYFQVRPEGDALYDSPYEPWSRFLTGTEGTAPEPYWDPLEFAVAEAHRLGMELHAWINPYRVLREVPGDFSKEDEEPVEKSLASFLGKEYDANAPKYKGTATRDPKHVANTHPEWILVATGGVTDYGFLDPGLQDVRDYTTMIISDIVRRYDVDGIHFDDYFYPYSPNNMAANAHNQALDNDSFAADPRGFTDKDSWRRNNVELLMEQVNDSIKAVKPWMKFGISPFGIYRNGLPFGISGTDAYVQLFTDPLKWAENGDVDYIMPQLYWKFGGGQDFQKLANWWAKEIAEKRGRHMYAGLGAYKADSNTFTGALYGNDEVPRQIRFTRGNDDISGTTIFRAKNITNYSTRGLRDSLITDFYRNPALIPTMDWLDTTPPAAPTQLIAAADVVENNVFTISWEPPASDLHVKLKDAETVDTLLYYSVYRVESIGLPDVGEVIANPENRIALTGEAEFTDTVEEHSNGNIYYVVTAVSRNGVESEPSEAVDAGVITSMGEEIALARGYRLDQNYPNPFNPVTNISFNLPGTGVTTLTVYDVLGREVAVLVNEMLTVGVHTYQFDAARLASGVYIYRLESNGVMLTKKLTLIK